MAKRAHDHEAMPLCTRCHNDLHYFQGAFEGMGQALRAVWQDTQIKEHRAQYAAGAPVAPY